MSCCYGVGEKCRRVPTLPRDPAHGLYIHPYAVAFHRRRILVIHATLSHDLRLRHSLDRAESGAAGESRRNDWTARRAVPSTPRDLALLLAYHDSRPSARRGLS